MNDKAFIFQARDNVSAASYSPRKLALIHTGVVAVVGLLVAVLNYLLNIGIGSTAGLSGIGTRTALETAQTVLQLISTVLTPFWAIGFIAAALQYANRGNPTPHTLLTGFRCWGPVLRLLLLQFGLYFLVAMAVSQVGSVLYSLSPASSRLYALMEQLTLEGGDMEQLLSQLDADVLMDVLLGMLPFLLIPMLAVILYLSYRLRFAQYLLMTFPRMGAMLAMAQSFKLTKGNCLRLLKLDLRYWWFYLLEVLVTVLCYGDLLLEVLGVNWGDAGWLASLLFYALALTVQTALYVWKKPQVLTTYALFYKSLLPQPENGDQSAVAA